VNGSALFSAVLLRKGELNMGYNMEQIDSSFFIEAKNASKVLTGLKEQGYDVNIDDDGNIDELSFIGEKLYKQFELFEKLAPMVRDGSFLKYQGGDGTLWKWVFKGGKCHEVKSKVVWDNEPGDETPHSGNENTELYIVVERGRVINVYANTSEIDVTVFDMDSDIMTPTVAQTLKKKVKKATEDMTELSFDDSAILTLLLVKDE